MLPSFPRRAVRRPIILLLVFSFIISGAQFLRSSLLEAQIEPKPTPSDETTRIHLAWNQTAVTKLISEPSSYDLRRQQSYFASKKKPLQPHLYRPDGLLEVNPDGLHPIFELIKNAEAEWNAKLGRASRNLHDAVAEYKRRYKRPPPLGFDAWYGLNIPSFELRSSHK